MPACTPPSYPPPSPCDATTPSGWGNDWGNAWSSDGSTTPSGNWGSDWGNSWSQAVDPCAPVGWGTGWGEGWGTGPSGAPTADWAGAWCITVEYNVPPSLHIQYSVPSILDVDYQVLYASPLRIEYNVPPPLTVAYKVAKPLAVSYDVLYASPLFITYFVSGNLTIEYDVGNGWPLAVDYAVPVTGPIDIEYAVSDPLVVDYKVWKVAPLDISYEVPAWARSLVVDYDVQETFRLRAAYEVVPDTYYSAISTKYTVVPATSEAALGIDYTVLASSSTPGWFVPDEVNGLVDLRVSSSEGAIRFSAVVVPDHPWASASVGDTVSIFLWGRRFKFIVQQKVYDTEKCLYTIDGSITVAELLGKPVTPLYAEDPVRKIIDTSGYVCLEDLNRLRSHVSRPTVLESIRDALGQVVDDYDIDSTIPGLGDYVPFDMWHGADEVTASEVVNRLIGWARPFIFVSPEWGVRIIGGWPTNARQSAVPTDPRANERAEQLVRLPRSVHVTGGPWPEANEPEQPPDECASDRKEPSELDTYELTEVTRTRIHYVGFATLPGDLLLPEDYDVAHKIVTHTIRKQCGVVVYEAYETAYEVWRPILAGGFTIVGYEKRMFPVEIMEIFYSYIARDGVPCPDALTTRVAITRRNVLSLAEDPSINEAIYNQLSNQEFVYRYEVETYEWAPKGYVARHSKRTVKVDTIHFTASGLTFKYVGQYDVVEKWLPLGNGLWLHTGYRTNGVPFYVSSDSRDVLNEIGSSLQGLALTELETFSEVTDNGPQHSDCAATQRTDCGREQCRYGSTSSPREGLTTYEEDVPIGGTAGSESITVPGLNLYTPIVSPFPDDNEQASRCLNNLHVIDYAFGSSSIPAVPPMDDGAPYAQYAANARKQIGYLRYEGVNCGELGTVPIAGDFLNGGLVTESSFSLRNGDLIASYTVVYFRS